MTLHTRIASTAVLAITLSACAAGGSQRASAPASAPTRIEVTNHNWADMRVYVVRSGTRFRLGTVSSMSTEVFQLPRTLAATTGGLQLVANPIGSRELHLTQTLNITPGQLVRFKVENHLAISSVSVW